MTVTDGRQLKAARVILGLTVREMAGAAGINRNTVSRVEALKTLPRYAHAADRIMKALEARGIAFTAGDGRAGILFEAATRRGRTPYVRRRPPAD